MVIWDPVFDPKSPPENVYVGPPFCVISQGNEAHKLFSWGPKMGVLGGGQKVDALSLSLICFPIEIKGV